MDFQEKYGSTIKQFAIPLVLGAAGLIFLGYGLIASTTENKKSDEIVFESANASDSAQVNEKKLIVDVEGAVEKPGIYELKPDSRIHDALIEAGGMSKDADREKIAKSLNLAGKVVDGGKIYIPKIGETPITDGASSDSSAGSDVMGDTTGVININSASSTELDTLSGVGPVTAEKIISNRPYESIEDLVSKKAVGQATFDKIKDNISVY